jgi:ATP-binding cassette, subfamily F, member 3
MSSYEIAEEIRSNLPETEEIVVQYLSGYLVDDAGEDEDVLQVARMILESVAGNKVDTLERLMVKIGDLLEDRLRARQQKMAAPKLQKLDKVVDMSKTGAMSNTIGLAGESVDLESINKGKCARCPSEMMSYPN